MPTLPVAHGFRAGGVVLSRGWMVMAVLAACLAGAPALVQAAKVTLLVRPVQIKAKGSDTWERLSMGDEVHEVDSIRTGKGGRAELSITPKRQFRIGSATEIMLTGLEEREPEKNFRATVQLFLGRFWGSVRTPLSGAFGEKVEVQTPTATIGIKGTSFGVDQDKDKGTDVAVVTGTVSVGPGVEIGPPKEVAGPREIAPPQEITREEWTELVQANTKLIIRPGLPPQRVPLTDEDKQDPWVAFNIARDQEQ